MKYVNSEIVYNKNQMKKNAVPKFCLLLDGRNRADYENFKEAELISEHPGIIPSKPLKTYEVFKDYLILKEELISFLKREKADLEFIAINDMHCGLGATLEIFALGFIEDDEFPGIHQNSIAIKGYDPDECLIDLAMSNLGRLSPNLDLVVGGLTTDCYSEILESLTEEKVSTEIGHVVIMPNIFVNEKHGLKSEEQVIKHSPRGTYFVFPHGVKGTYSADLKFITKHIFKKEGDVKRIG